jgi:hypothetical protein
MILGYDVIDLEGKWVARLGHLAVFAAMAGALFYELLQRAFHSCSVRPWFFSAIVPMALERPASL